MWLPRPRVTVRRLMVVVAIVSLFVRVPIERHLRFSRLARFHEIESMKVAVAVTPRRPGTTAIMLTGIGWWHFKMELKYEFVPRYPWLPVLPDPPPPDD